jgi:carboxyl-terminal processing protease
MKWAAQFIFFFFSVSALAQSPRDFQHETLLLQEVLSKNHYAPRVLNDRFASDVFGHLLERLDPERMYFTAQEIQQLTNASGNIDDELSGKGWGFFNALKDVYKKGVERYQAASSHLLQSPFNWKLNEYYWNDTSRWQQDDQQLINKHRLWLKYQTLERLGSMAGLEEPEPDFLSRHESEARQRVKSSELRKVNRILKHPAGFDTYFASQFFQSVTAVYDPHTSYLSATEMENFMSMLSTEGYYFGLTLGENDRGEISIASLAPGGPAWKSGELNASDVLLMLKWENQESFDMAGLSVEEANEILADANHGTMELTVRKTDGLEKTVRIRKEKLSSEDSYVRSFVLEGPIKVGYISLPDFYTRWGNTSEGSQCASDVAKEILKLKKEKIAGLILDIRYNGGGSLQEAIALAGIFVDEGTLGFLKDRDQKATSLKDMNRGTIYDGPLLLMVNGQSASASEFLAAAMQDYNRAIIAGSRTFGKATAQNIFPLDKTKQDESGLASIKNDVGYATITTDKLYRTTGKTAQGKGIVPDVLIPDVFDVINYHEENIRFAIPADSVSRKSFYKSLKPLPLEMLQAKSKIRLDSNKAFQEMKEIYSWVGQQTRDDEQPVLLSWQALVAKHKNEVRQQKVVARNFSTATNAFQVHNNAMDLERNAVDEYAKDFSALWATRLKNDIVLAEAYQIISDYIGLLRKP